MRNKTVSAEKTTKITKSKIKSKRIEQTASAITNVIWPVRIESLFRGSLVKINGTME
jgi:hypothetical protein